MDENRILTANVTCSNINVVITLPNSGKHHEPVLSIISNELGFILENNDGSYKSINQNKFTSSFNNSVT